jgi:DNA-binding transcriptional regulator YhcF (GntR family)
MNFPTINLSKKQFSTLLLCFQTTIMRNIYEKIQELEAIPTFSKHEQLVQGITNAIDEKLLTTGDILPSVNNMIKEIGFARETIVKAYSDLKNRGIIESKNRLGYFVTNKDTEQTLKVALMMYAYDTFQELFYSSFRKELGNKVHVDVFFHHGNIEVFETMFNHIKGKYGMYVVSPIPHSKTAPLLQSLPLNKFLMFDRHEPLEGDFCYVTQEFRQASYDAFVALHEPISKFDEIHYYYDPASITPIQILQSFKKFLKDFNIKGKVHTAYVQGSVTKGKIYFTVNNNELYSIIKDCKMKGLVIGKDVGILTHDDEPVKEIIADGITTYSTDFAMMGKKAAQYVLTREKVQETIPSVLIRRNSL